MTNNPPNGSSGDLESVYEDRLRHALREVSIPDGLESRLQDAVAPRAVVELSVPGGLPALRSRRAWMSAAAVLVGATAVGRYRYSHRVLSEAEIVAAAGEVLNSKDWVLPWSPMDSRPDFPLPRRLKKPRGWQYVKAAWSNQTAAFDLTLPGGPPAVLLVAAVSRDLSALPGSLPEIPRQRSQGWSQISVWQNSGNLYVLAAKGVRRDYDALWVGAGSPLLA